ncbi:rRNA-processing protein las1 [Pichia californica]|uniref:rRNA-processing protein las1 n=1 Tax=Pichia californica TaxID=460514 RepID=A0A9P7BDT6_9ASCO|nr:rRNA-processing protein las1 [[Candida] californica]KAG0687196.1 rRNA-processing protein las1 [[Candida] californica]
MNNPQITPYKFPKELEVLYDNFFKSKNRDVKRQGISKVRGYLTKGPIPHSIEMTALLIEVIINDEEKNGIQLFKYEDQYPVNFKNLEISSDLSIRLQYSMCIIKFVNGLLDPFQQSIYNISLHKLAIELKLPNYFVEARHVSTHERLPTLEMMRLISQRALNWLKIEYWENAIKQYNESNLMDININDWVINIRKERQLRIKRENDEIRIKNNNSNLINQEDIKNLDNILKNIKKLRREEIQTNKKKDNELLNEIKKFQEILSTKSDEFIIRMILFKNYLILHGNKNENLNEKQLIGLRMIWGNIIKELDNKFNFKLWIKLFELSVNKCNVKYDQLYVEKKILNNEDIKYLSNECEYEQCKGWVKWILENINLINKSNINKFIDILIDNKSEISKECMIIFKRKYYKLINECELNNKINKIENIMNKFWILNDNNEFISKELQDIEPEIDEYIETKRIKVSTFNLFDTFPSWRPVPFGCPP